MPSPAPSSEPSPASSAAAPAASSPVAASAAVGPRFDERLTAPRSWWVIAGLLGLSGGLVMFPLGTVATLGGLIVAAVVAGAAVSSYGSARVRVVAGSLVAGNARIPVSALGAAEVLDEEEARAWRTYKADPRAFMLMRSYVPRAVRVEITDPADPTPYAYLSSREPEALVAALESVRAEA
ncbi:membrane protein [Streptomyces gardneri]|uniref:Membrane protein n=1 Tax=Streptomyces gardneri TaxID=66892 RepID=A0A4Y3RFM0_9ACTN|nr:membrane protein [Streptomyces gardneri]